MESNNCSMSLLVSTASLLLPSNRLARGFQSDGVQQLVALADVYDALTSERCYKKAFSHEKAVQMILNGECGAFNPLLLQCLTDMQTDLKVQLQQRTQ